MAYKNFRQRPIEALLKTAALAPMVNQIRLCPGDTDTQLSVRHPALDTITPVWSLHVFS